ncbi:hypothetical protein E4Z66_11710 [Aliishimia ponticola]|uniref:DUF1349 domain-containing protein n=1 Tax=Aliishimia ponticola TaxID=2499833 RepID=A0A4S4NCG4_9RHOB|nr:hypothetical protein [Aliishimia ponticola]THH35748.1 hypothetical protein E4Z66_11710 [Aliishimia ponticola]
MWRSLVLSCLPVSALACGAPICRVAPDTLELAQIITFDDLPSGWDPGHRVDDLLRLPGASFAERFAGQTLGAEGDHDTVSGPALAPLTLLPGAPGQTLSVVRLYSSNILNGYGPAGYPWTHGQGEGAIAVLFDEDQPALSFQVLGGEDGAATVQFLRRDGSVIHVARVGGLGPVSLGFRRADDLPDIAGFVITNTDPQGLAIDNLRFGPPPKLG